MDKITQVQIERDSEAGIAIWKILDDIDTYKLSIDVRTNGIAVKRNESMWSPTLETAREDSQTERAPLTAENDPWSLGKAQHESHDLSKFE